MILNGNKKVSEEKNCGKCYNFSKKDFNLKKYVSNNNFHTRLNSESFLARLISDSWKKW